MGIFSSARRGQHARLCGLVLAGYLLLASLFYAPVLLASHTFRAGDFTEHFLPFSLFQRSELVAGRLPVWNPYTYAGHPFLGDVQAAVYYPLSNLLLAITLPWDAAPARLYWLQVEAVLHIALAGLFVYLLLRELTGRRGAGLVSGCVFALSGYLTGYPPLQLAILRTAIWLPLVMLLLWRAFAHPHDPRRWIAASMAYACAFLAGHPQTFLFLTYVTACWIALLALTRWRRGGMDVRARASLAVSVIMFFVVSIALSAAQLWPSLEFLRESVRASTDYASLSGGFPVQDSWQLLLPGVLTLFSPLYVGIVGVGLALFAVTQLVVRAQPNENAAATVFPSQRALILFFSGVTLLFLLASYGNNGFLYPILYRVAPGWNLFRNQERAAYIVAFGLSVLAGYGAALVHQSQLRVRRLFACGFALLVAGGVLIFGLYWQTSGRTAVTAQRFVALSCVALLCAALLAALLWTRRPGRWQVSLLTLLIVADLFYANGRTSLDPSGLQSRAVLPPEALALAESVRQSADPVGRLPGRAYNEHRVFADYGMQANVEDVWGSSPLRLARYDMLFRDFPLDRLWRLTGVTHVLTWRRELFEPSALLAEFAQAKDTTYLHRLQEPNPRAWIVHSIRLAEDAEAVRLLADHEFDLERFAILPPDQARVIQTTGLPVRDSAVTGPSTVDLRRVKPNHTRAYIRTEQAGVLVVGENWMPGWRAVLRAEHGEERAATVRRVNLSFLGVVVPPGVSAVDLVYWPASVQYGLVLSGTTLFLLLLICVLWHRQVLRR